MNRYRAIVAEAATGIVRRADSPAMRYRQDDAGENSRTFRSEEEALQFKDDILQRFVDVEVTVRPEEATRGGVRYYWKQGAIIGEIFAS